MRSELFHYEVRATYDTPEVADNRRIVGEAKSPKSGTTEWKPDDDESGGTGASGGGGGPSW